LVTNVFKLYTHLHALHLMHNGILLEGRNTPTYITLLERQNLKQEIVLNTCTSTYTVFKER